MFHQISYTLEFKDISTKIKCNSLCGFTGTFFFKHIIKTFNLCTITSVYIFKEDYSRKDIYETLKILDF